MLIGPLRSPSPPLSLFYLSWLAAGWLGRSPGGILGHAFPAPTTCTYITSDPDFPPDRSTLGEVGEHGGKKVSPRQ